MCDSHRFRRAGFTLVVELLIVLVIVGIPPAGSLYEATREVVPEGDYQDDAQCSMLISPNVSEEGTSE